MSQHKQNPILYTTQEIWNEAFNDSYKIPTVANYGYDATTDSFKPVPLVNGGLADPDLAIQIDDATSTVSYIGKALPGTATSAAAWQIKKIDSTSGTIITWASGNSNFDKVWDNRASLSYS